LHIGQTSIIHSFCIYNHLSQNHFYIDNY
jgi:hypothetical protein